ncbi:hypothetical protein FBY04_1552 [Pseudomonas sp. SJZ080]|nr:hypothetical protein FBY04_1552 [Pseudomonas sp. SJZ080]
METPQAHPRKNVIGKAWRVGIEEFFTRYLMGKRAGSLIQEYGIATSSSNLIGLYHPIAREDELCPYCAIAMLHKRRSKFAREVSPIKCAQCSHRIEIYFGRTYSRVCRRSALLKLPSYCRISGRLLYDARCYGHNGAASAVPSRRRWSIHCARLHSMCLVQQLSRIKGDFLIALEAVISNVHRRPNISENH